MTSAQMTSLDATEGDKELLDGRVHQIRCAHKWLQDEKILATELLTKKASSNFIIIF